MKDILDFYVVALHSGLSAVSFVLLMDVLLKQIPNSHWLFSF